MKPSHQSRRKQTTLGPRKTKTTQTPAHRRKQWWPVDSLCGQRIRIDNRGRKQREYNVVWAGTSDNGDSWPPSWEPRSNITRAALDAWHKKRTRVTNSTHRQEDTAVGIDDVDGSDSLIASSRAESHHHQDTSVDMEDVDRIDSTTAHTNANTKLDGLPQEILEKICEYVAQGEPTRLSLRAFACTNRMCHLGAKHELYSLAEIRVTGNADQLSKNVSQLERRLVDHERHLRMLEIWGGPSQQRAEDISTRDVANDVVDIRDLRAEEHYPCLLDEDAWQVIASFLRRLKEVYSVRLRDVVWVCQWSMPKCVLTALHDHQRDCRLHAHTLSLPSLYRSRPLLLSLEPEKEHPLATLSCLYSLLGPIVSTHTTCRQLLSRPVLFDMLLRYSPRVRHVYEYGGGHQLSQTRPWIHFRTPKEPEILTDIAPTTKVRLASLHTAFGHDEFPCRGMEDRLDLSVLVSLTLHFTIGENDGSHWDYLAELAEMGYFGALEELAVQDELESTGTPFSDVDMARFLRAVRPLQTIRLSSVGDETFTAMLNRHGTQLRILHLVQRCLTYEDVVNLSQTCRRVHDLRVGIPRTLGDEAEVDLYRLLGTMPVLAKLTLELYSMKGFTCTPKASIRWALLNTAVDGPHVLSIFDAIRTASRLAQPMLAELIIRFVDVSEQKGWRWCMGTRDVLDVLMAIALSWKVERTAQGILRDPPRVTRLRRKGWSIRNPLRHQCRESPNTGDWSMGQWREVWDELWPGPNGTWHSLPLANSQHSELRQTMLGELQHRMNQPEPVRRSEPTTRRSARLSDAAL